MTVQIGQVLMALSDEHEQSHLYTELGQPGSSWTQYGDYCFVGQAQNKRIRHVVTQ